MDLQNIMDAMNKTASIERGKYQLTLGKLIEALKSFDQNSNVIYAGDAFWDSQAPSAPESYRGYYSDLSFPPSTKPITVSQLLKIAERAVGRTFKGYKGGDFKMSEMTPLWTSPYGDANGFAIMHVKYKDGLVILVTKQID